MVDLKTLDTKSLILDMTTNLSRIGNFTLNKNYEKANYFADELEKYIKELNTREYDKRLTSWIDKTEKIIKELRTENFNNKDIAEDSFTSGIVLQNRVIYLL